MGPHEIAWQLFDDAFFIVELEFMEDAERPGNFVVQAYHWPRLELCAESKRRVQKTVSVLRALDIGIELLPPKLYVPAPLRPARERAKQAWLGWAAKDVEDEVLPWKETS
jgi:hypothetical protein